MATYPLGPWRPDAAALGAPGVLRVINALVGINGYKPFPALNVTSTALSARPRGALAVRDGDGNVRQFVGDAAKLYELVGDTWTDRSKSGGYLTADEERWEMVQFKGKLLATNFGDSPQQILLGSSQFSDLTTDFRARHIAVVGDHVVVGNTFDTTDDAVGDRVRLSSFQNETAWTVDPFTGADYRDLGVGGHIERIIGGEYGVIVSESSIFRLSLVGAPTWFQVNETLPGIGTIAAGSVTSLGNIIFLWSEQGLVAITGGGTNVEPIGANKIDKFARNDLDMDNHYLMSAVVDPTARRVAWAYPGSGNSGRPNKILIYDIPLAEWTIIEQETELIWRGGGISYTADSVDLLIPDPDTFDGSPDDDQWKGDRPQFSAFNSAFRHGPFDGDNMTAEWDTAELELHPGRRTHLNGFRPLIDGGTVTAKLAERNKQSESVTFGSSLSPHSMTGIINTRSNARFHRMRFTASGAWTDAMGFEIDPEDARMGERY